MSNRKSYRAARRRATRKFHQRRRRIGRERKALEDMGLPPLPPADDHEKRNGQ